MGLALYDELAERAASHARAGIYWVAPAVVARAALGLREHGGRHEHRVNSSARSNEHQARLYRNRRPGVPVARPGTSKHNPGLPGAAPIPSSFGDDEVERITRDGWALALDISPTDRSVAGYRRLERALVNWGLRLTVGVAGRTSEGIVTARRSSHEPWHYEPNPTWRPTGLRGVLYFGARIKQLPRAPQTNDVAVLIAWLREQLKFPGKTGHIDMFDIIGLTSLELYFAGLNRPRLP